MHYVDITNETEYQAFLHERGRKIAATMAALRERGEVTGAAPLGHKIHTNPYGVKEYIPDPETWPLVRESILRYRIGEGVRPLLTEMTERGLRSRSGNVLSPSAFLYMVENGVYEGFI
jgi:hypothetical protein